MKRCVQYLFSSLVLVGMVAMWLSTTGCDNAAINDQGTLTVAPGETTLTEVNQMLTLTVNAGATNEQTIVVQPLSWSVSDPELGDIVSVVGLTAVYLSSKKAGNNIITVRDRLDAVGIAVVVQDVANTNLLSVSPGETALTE